MKNIKLKTKETKSKGITLVALIISIIILLILATVSISLVMNGNLIGKSKSAVDKYSDEEIAEQIKLAYSEWQMGRYMGETKTAAIFVKEKLNEVFGTGTVTDVIENNGVLTIFFSNENEYLYNIGTSIVEKKAKWKANGDGTWTHSISEDKIQIGDIVNYDPTKDVNGNTLTTTYTSYAAANTAENKNNGRTSGYDSDQTFSVNAKTNGWRVLGVNESGQIELISSDPITTVSNKNYYLKGEKGYLDGPNELNAICSIFGQGKGADSARSLKVDDVDKLAGITTDEDKKAITYNVYGYTYKYRYPEGGSNMQYKVIMGTYVSPWIDETNSNYQTFRMPGAELSTEINSTNPIESPELTHTAYSYSISEKITKTNISDLICSGKNYWLASNFIIPSSGGSEFGVFRIIYEGVNLYYGRLFFSNNTESSYSTGIRPVVTLKSNIQLSGNSAAGWTIQ